MKHRLNGFLPAVLFLAAVAGHAESIAPDIAAGRDGMLVLALKNSSSTQAHPAVGMLLSRSCPSGRCGVFATCSLVLVAADVALTAAHCVENPDKEYHAFFPGTSLMTVAAGGVTRFCDGRDDCDPVSGDLAALRLSRPVTGIAPVARSSVLPSKGVMVGHGDSAPARPDNGILREATVPIERCGPRLLCYRFDEASPAACNHDSGGPILSPDGLLLGLASQTEADCVAGKGTYIRVAGPWVDSWWQDHVERGRGSPETPVSTRPVLDVDCTRQPCWSTVGAVGLRLPFEVGDNDRSLIVSINYALRTDQSGCEAPDQDSCVVDYDLELEAPETGRHLCHCENSFNQVSVCSCELPAAGNWTAVIRSAQNTGPFQVTGRTTMLEDGAAE
ncbi:MAG: trypsin-like serine protease [Gammaproteobacteria bacterium]